MFRSSLQAEPVTICSARSEAERDDPPVTLGEAVTIRSTQGEGERDDPPVTVGGAVTIRCARHWRRL
jgi:hypothetical protein